MKIRSPPTSAKHLNFCVCLQEHDVDLYHKHLHDLWNDFNGHTVNPQHPDRDQSDIRGHSCSCCSLQAQRRQRQRSGAQLWPEAHGAVFHRMSPSICRLRRTTHSLGPYRHAHRRDPDPSATALKTEQAFRNCPQPCPGLVVGAIRALLCSVVRRCIPHRNGPKVLQGHLHLGFCPMRRSFSKLNLYAGVGWGGFMTGNL